MTTRVAALKRNRENNEFALSIRGKILSRVWAVYCVCRVFSASVHVTLFVPPFSLTHPPLPVHNEFAISTAIHGRESVFLWGYYRAHFRLLGFTITGCVWEAKHRRAIVIEAD